ncbi:hypothetical protein D3C73_1260020 [compost metagenome]
MPIMGDHLRQHIVADGAAGTDAQCAAVMAEQLFNLPRLLQQCQRLRVQQPAMLINDQTLAHAVKQLHAQLPFQIGQRGADRRL